MKSTLWMTMTKHNRKCIYDTFGHYTAKFVWIIQNTYNQKYVSMPVIVVIVSQTSIDRNGQLQKLNGSPFYEVNLL